MILFGEARNFLFLKTQATSANFLKLLLFFKKIIKKDLTNYKKGLIVYTEGVTN